MSAGWAIRVTSEARLIGGNTSMPACSQASAPVISLVTVSVQGPSSPKTPLARAGPLVNLEPYRTPCKPASWKAAAHARVIE